MARRGGLSTPGIDCPAATTRDFAWVDALSESNLCVPLALPPVSEQFRTRRGLRPQPNDILGEEELRKSNIEQGVMKGEQEGKAKYLDSFDVKV